MSGPWKKKVKFPVKRLLARGQQQLLKRWLRYVESLKYEEEVVHICEPEDGRNLSDEEEVRSDEDLINFQGSRDGFSYCQVGNEMRLLEDLIDCQEDSSGNSYFQVGNDMRLAEDFINCQVGRNGISICQVGNGKRSSGGIVYCQRRSDESSYF
jgi:hypothetical protein